MEDRKQNKESRPVRCDCGKVVAVEYNGKVFVYCKRCKRQIQIQVCKFEPRA